MEKNRKCERKKRKKEGIRERGKERKNEGKLLTRGETVRHGETMAWG